MSNLIKEREPRQTSDIFNSGRARVQRVGERLKAFPFPKKNKEDALLKIREGLTNTYAGVNPNVVIGEITEGSTSNVYRAGFGDEHVVVKVTRSKIVPPLLGSLPSFSISTRASNVISRLALGNKDKFANTPDFVKEGLNEYSLIRKYFGDPSLDPQAQSLRSELMSSLRTPDSSFYKKILGITGNDLSVMEKVARVFERNKDTNFLQHEDLFIGAPADRTREEIDRMNKKGKILVAANIIQEEVRGDVIPLLGIKTGDLLQRQELLERLLIFALIQKNMYVSTDKMIDTRPKEVLRHPFEWFQKTANILVERTTNRVFFVDTRLLWDKTWQVDATYGRSLDRAIRQYAELLPPGF